MPDRKVLAIRCIGTKPLLLAKTGLHPRKGAWLGALRILSLSWLAPLAANLAWRSAVDFSKDGVEASQAPESCPHRDLGHRQASFVEQAFSSLHACGLCHF